MKYHDIVTIGNGTGTGVILRSLRKLADLDRVTALVGVTDNGGHSGALRRELGVPSMGDIKTVIAALTGETVWGQLFRHRFSEGRLKGISIGNLMLSALAEEGGSLYHATRRLTQALDIRAHIMPISDTDAQVVAELSDGTEVIGEWETINRKNRDAAIIGVHHLPEMETIPHAIKALDRAHWIIICPGTFWLGLGSILKAPMVRETISASNATLIVIGNILTQPGVTDGWSATDHYRELEEMLGRNIDFYLLHDGEVPEKVLDRYREKGFRRVENKLESDHTQIVRGDLISPEFLLQVDRIHYNPERGYPHAMRHDPSMLARILLHVAEATPEDEMFEEKPREERYDVKDF